MATHPKRMKWQGPPGEARDIPSMQGLRLKAKFAVVHRYWDEPNDKYEIHLLYGLKTWRKARRWFRGYKKIYRGTDIKLINLQRRLCGSGNSTQDT